MSLSPELFLRRRATSLESWPIKGTAARGASPNEDEERRRVLIDSVKEQAELLMITDLMRNDLIRCCLPATVHVPQLRQCIAYRHIFQMHSVIQGTIDERLSSWDILRYCFPAGSVTGCPKEAAMDVITQLERRQRRSYCGAIGYLIGEEYFDFNVAIRTLEMTAATILLQVGGAVTIDSDPFEEYMETLHKARPFLQILGLSDTIPSAPYPC